MSRGFNKVIIMGNLARDPDVRHTPSKQKVARITVAVGRQWKNKATGELENRTDFISVVAWGFSADICERYLAKGRPVLIEGRLQVRDYDDPKTGQHKWITEVLAENITLMSAGRREDGAESVPPPRARAAAPVQQKAGYQDFPVKKWQVCGIKPILMSFLSIFPKWEMKRGREMLIFPSRKEWSL